MRKLLILVLALFFIAACEQFERQPGGSGQPSGSLDGSFANGGTAEVYFNGTVNGMVILGDNSIIVGGIDSPSGTPNATFVHLNEVGVQELTYGGGSGYAATALSTMKNFNTDSNGDIVVAGAVSALDTSGNFVETPEIVRLLPNGNADGTFVNGGPAVLLNSAIGNGFQMGGIAVQYDNKVYAGGTISPAAGEPAVLALVRFNTNGSIDSSFGSSIYGFGAVVLTSAGLGLSQSYQTMVIQPDDKVLVAGTSCSEAPFDTACPIILTRVNSDGSIDSSFGGTGAVAVTGHTVGSLALQTDGNIVMGDALGGFDGIVRYTTTGTLDTTYGTSGEANSPGIKFAIDFENNLIIPSRSDLNTMVINRMLTTGQIDPGYNNIGLSPTLTSLSAPAAIAIDYNGNYVIAGSVGDVNGTTALNLLVQRYFY